MTLWQKKELLQKHTPEDLYFAEPETLRSLPELSDSLLSALLNRDLTDARDILARCKEKKIQVLPWGDSKYPDRLRNIEDPPVVLYYRGRIPDWNARPFLGVVGTRKATLYGLQMSERLGEEISCCGGMVVSGGAGGIDTRAMEGALTAGFPVVGVLGCGPDIIYPRNNRKLFSQVIEEGCLLSEYAPGVPPLGWHFLKRNRILSGICHGVIVAEAPERSGALDTAKHALEQGRDVYAVPANVGNTSCAGSNRLLQDGAGIVLRGWDAVRPYAGLFPDTVKEPKQTPAQQKPLCKVAQKPVIPEESEKLGIDNRGHSSYSVINDGGHALSCDEQAVLSQLSRHPIHPDQVAAECGLPASKVQTLLTMLTLKGLAEHHPGGLVSLK